MIIDKHFQNSLQFTAVMQSKQYGVEVEFGGNSAYTNGKRIVLPIIDLEKSAYSPTIKKFIERGHDPREVIRKLYVGLGDHEAGGHGAHTDFEVMQEVNDELTRKLLNVIEDPRVDRLNGLLYPGSKTNLREYDELMYSEGPKYPAGPVDPLVLLHNYMLSTLIYNMLGHAVMKPFIEVEKPLMEKTFPPEFVTKLDSILNEAVHARDSWHALELAKKVVALLKEEAQKQQQQSQASDSSKEDQAQDCQNGSSDDSSQDDDSEGQTGQGSATSDSSEDEKGGSESQSQAESQSPDSFEGEPEKDGQDDSSSQGSQDQGEEGKDQSGSSSSTSDSSEDGMDDADETSDSSQEENSLGQDGSTSKDSQSQDGESQDQAKEGGSSDEGQGDDQDSGDCDGSTSSESESGDSERNSSSGSASSHSQSSYKDVFDATLDPKNWEQLPEGKGEELKALLNEIGLDCKADDQDVKPAIQVPYPDNDITPLDENEVAAEAGFLMGHLGAVLQDYERMHTHYKRSGTRVDTRRIYRLKFKDTLIFKAESQKKIDKAAIHFMLDNSGSMGCWRRQRMPLALRSTLAMTMALRSNRRFNTAITAFPGNSSYDCTTLLRHGERYTNEIGIAPTGYTPLGQAVWNILPDLLACREDRKILFVITDGGPTPLEAAIMALEDARSYGVEAFCLGIEVDANDEENLASMFGDNFRCITSIEEMPEAVFGMLEAALIR
ncbi:hypothetical protein [Pseudodesulfovibrio pelocollis]|uniref:hypothetical protein n=1 Tax=Pseudodesulfovibrio pelocollis TaxID=3051432 RepID=UPI00255AADD2|nr:hypothetical protein [Pseudodesulfovibrio sp. SB368]